MKLFIYDHCPYCVRARMIFGIKNLPVQLVTLLNDDEKTPKSLIGQKMVPILEKAPKSFMPESMDIVTFVDKSHPPAIVSAKEDKALVDLLHSIRDSYYSLTMPRWSSSNMEEFKTPSAKAYFQRKKENMIGSFFQAVKNTSIFKKEINHVLLEIEDKMPAKKPWYEGSQLSFNDFYLFAFLRGLSIVKELNFPPLLAKYAQRVSKTAKVPLNHSIAL